MPRKPKYPEHVTIRIPRELVEVYELSIFDLLFSEKESKIAEKVVNHIIEHERLWPDEYHEFIDNPADRVRYFRVLRKMVSLGMISRGKEGSYILNNEFSLKLSVYVTKWDAILKKAERKKSHD